MSETSQDHLQHLADNLERLHQLDTDDSRLRKDRCAECRRRWPCRTHLILTGRPPELSGIVSTIRDLVLEADHLLYAIDTAFPQSLGSDMLAQAAPYLEDQFGHSASLHLVLERLRTRKITQNDGKRLSGETVHATTNDGQTIEGRLVWSGPDRLNLQLPGHCAELPNEQELAYTDLATLTPTSPPEDRDEFGLFR